MDQKLFNRYPLRKDAVSGETTFEAILQKFVEEKTKKINLSENATTVAVGLGNLKIDAFMDINPNVINTGNFKIYKNGNKKRMVVQNSTGLRIIYEDNYTERWHEVYNQSQIRYDQFNQGGFGPAVKADVQTSWVTIPSTTTKLKVSVNAQNFQDNLVRESSNKQKIFTFDYDNSRNLVINPVNAPWLRSRLLNFQRLINMTPRFEYWTEESRNWRTLTTLNDAEMGRIWSNQNQNTFTIPASTVRENITKLRLRLIPNSINDANSFVEFSGYNENDNKFISADQEANVQRIDINNAWFNEVTLTNNSSSLALLNASDFESYENQIFGKSNAIKQNPSLRSKVKLMYKWNGENNLLDKNGIATLIQQRLTNFGSTDQGVFALWNGVTGIKIQAIFTTVDDSVAFTVGNNMATEAQLRGDVKSNIKNEINLGPYISELMLNPISTIPGNVVGEFLGTNIQFPAKSGKPGSSQFAGKSYDDIKNILNNVEVSIRYKQWENNRWSDWKTDLNQINKYNPSNPQIKIGFKINSSAGKTWNIKLKNNRDDITDDSDFTLNLNLPKLVKLPTDVNGLINQFKQQNPFGGNTYNLDVNSTKLAAAKSIVINALKQASVSGSDTSGYNNLENYIELKFQLGNSQWLEANQLKNTLSAATEDQSSNSLKMKVEMTQNTSFILE